MNLASNRVCVSALAIAACALLQPNAVLAQAAATDAAADIGIADIIVTASKRDVSLQKESRSITALSADTLARNGIADPASVQNLVPGLTIARNGQQLQVSIRGVGDRTVNSATDPAVALNIDGIYYPKSYEASAAFFDLERIEVLKGPQGTLYGRNASSGVVNLITAKPKFDTSGFGEVEFGNYDAKRFTGALNVALGSSVAVRIAGQVVDRNGYLTDGYNDAVNQAIRGQVLIAPEGSDTSLLLNASYAHQGGKGDAGVIARRFGTTPPITNVPTPANAWAGPTDPATLARVAATNSNPVSGGAQNMPTRNGYQNVNTYTLSAVFEHKMPWATLTIVPSYVGSTIKNLSYAALVVATYQDTKSDQFSLEARLSSPKDSRVNWVLGAIYSREDVNDNYQSWVQYPNGVLPGPGPAIFVPNVVLPAYAPNRDDDSFGVFGEANTRLTDTFRIITGLRYTHEVKNVVGRAGTFVTFGAPVVFPLSDALGQAAAVNDISGRTAADKVNFRLGAEYDISPSSMLYATVATGYKAGGFYNDISPNNSYRPEELTAYDFGIRNRFLNDRLQVNLEAFYWKYKDKQETFLGVAPGLQTLILLTQNAASATLYGADLSVIAKLTHNDQISGDVEYNHNKYDKYLVTTASGTIDNSGRQLVRAPEWSGHIAYEHTQPLGDLGKLVLNGQMRFTSSYWLQNDFTSIERQPAYQVYDASLTWTSANDRLSVTGFIKNIGNQVYYSQGIQAPTLTDAVIGSVGDPRTFGVRLKAKF